MPEKLIDALAPEDYATFVERRISPKVKQRGRLGMLMYFAAKAVEEAVEFQKILVKYEYHGLEYEEKDLWDEAGDMRFYNQAIVNALGVTAPILEGMNKAKLNARGEYADYIEQKNRERWENSGLPHRDHGAPHWHLNPEGGPNIYDQHDDHPYTPGHTHPNVPHLGPAIGEFPPRPSPDLADRHG
jgi:PAS domain-containing protein